LRNMFVTLVYGRLTLSTGALEYCNAGHNLPLIIRTDGDISFTDKSKGIGLCLKADFEYRQQTLQLSQGDTLFMYTDGITEAVNSDGVMFGEENLLDVVRTHSDSEVASLIESVRDEVEQYVGNEPKSDDLTLMALRYVG
ncbi:MAG: PP2C family protein-serine/threonine phosphatase, partial [Bacteroidetes bacterium]|nr:PP2C family protein-serine/threonine phosphatase [Bacteroidota bacterium]